MTNEKITQTLSELLTQLKKTPPKNGKRNGKIEPYQRTVTDMNQIITEMQIEQQQISRRLIRVEILMEKIFRNHR